MSRQLARLMVASLLAVILGLGFSLPALAQPAPEGPSRWTPSSANDPLLVIMDVSGSMDDTDSSGRTKLDGAKAALSDLVQRRPSQSRTGLWIYPGTSNSCHPGGYVGSSGLGEIVNPSTLAATIRTLEADGETPTGPALRAAGESLQNSGISAATVLLVSDGESNCGENACEVAEELTAQGYDITVEALGFEISDTGRNELECIAAATNGNYYNITDSDELETMVSRLTVANLEMDVTAPAQSALGSSALIEVSIQNPSTRDIRNATVSLIFEGQGTRDAFPGVIPPRYQLGNIPAGQTVTRKWTVSTGSGAPGGTANWAVTAAAENAAAVSERGSIQMVEADLTIDMAGPVLKNIDRSSGNIAIMGDSYSSGEGSGDYLDQGSTTALCHRSYNTHTVPVMKNTTFSIIACSGAQAVHIDSFQDKEAHNKPYSAVDSEFGFAFPQALQLSRLPQPQNAVVMTLGGNDIGFSDIIAICAAPSPIEAPCHQDQGLKWSIWAQLPKLQSDLATSYEKVDTVLNSPDWIERRGGARAPIFILAYPQVLPDESRFGQCEAFNVDEVTFGNKVVRDLNQAIERAVDLARNRGVNVHFVPNTELAMLPNHTACDEDPYINPLEPASAFWLKNMDRKSMQQLFHPNTSGYLAMSNELIKWSATADLTEVPPPNGRSRPPLTFINRPSSDRSVILGEQSNFDLRTGETVTVSAEGFTPGSPSHIRLHSQPVALASTAADEQGRVRATIAIPPSTKAGQHTLHVQGVGAQGNWADMQQPVTVKQKPPWWITTTLLLAISSALGALVAHILRWKNREPHQLH